MSRDFRQATRARRNPPAAAARDFGALAMPLSLFILTWIVCAAIAALSWDNLIGNTPGAIDFGVTARLVLAVSFGLPGAALVSLACGVVRER